MVTKYKRRSKGNASVPITMRYFPDTYEAIRRYAFQQNMSIGMANEELAIKGLSLIKLKELFSERVEAQKQRLAILKQFDDICTALDKMFADATGKCRTLSLRRIRRGFPLIISTGASNCSLKATNYIVKAALFLISWTLTVNINCV